MTIIEVAKAVCDGSTARYKRNKWGDDCYITVFGENNTLIFDESGDEYALEWPDLQADDWEGVK